MKVDLCKSKEICSLVRKNCPYESPWAKRHLELDVLVKQAQKTTDNSLKQSFNKKIIEFVGKIGDLTKALNNIRETTQIWQHSPLNYFQQLVLSIHKYKAQNCAEAAEIVYMTSRINGINDSDLNFYELWGKKEKDYSQERYPFLKKMMDDYKEREFLKGLRAIDHVFVGIKNEKEEFGVDTIFNETSSTKELSKIYKTKYKDALNISEDEEIKFRTQYAKYAFSFPRLNDDEAAELKRLFPSFVLESKKD